MPSTWCMMRMATDNQWSVRTVALCSKKASARERSIENILSFKTQKLTSRGLAGKVCEHVRWLLVWCASSRNWQCRPKPWKPLCVHKPASVNWGLPYPYLNLVSPIQDHVHAFNNWQKEAFKETGWDGISYINFKLVSSKHFIYRWQVDALVFAFIALPQLQVDVASELKSPLKHIFCHPWLGCVVAFVTESVLTQG